MKFQVPQFIEVEDKIFGPLTFKQFIYLAGGAGISFTFYTILPKFISIILIIVIMIFSGALAFYKKNNKPFVYLLESAFKYWASSKLYIWKKDSKKKKEKVEKTNVVSQLNIPRLSDSKLKEISWELDIKDK
ncbi:MAG: PrgI family protein [Candidatus Pacebacteria bacterium]|nr:PrgI family protein [Candidatus Paceibacterota bacterium]